MIDEICTAPQGARDEANCKPNSPAEAAENSLERTKTREKEIQKKVYPLISSKAMFYLGTTSSFGRAALSAFGLFLAFLGLQSFYGREIYHPGSPEIPSHPQLHAPMAKVSDKPRQAKSVITPQLPKHIEQDAKQGPSRQSA